MDKAYAADLFTQALAAYHGCTLDEYGEPAKEPCFTCLDNGDICAEALTDALADGVEL